MRAPDYRRIAKRLIFLPLWIILPLVLLSAILLSLIFVRGMEEHPLAYAVYVLSFYTLSVLSVFCYRTLPGYIRRARAWLYSTELGNRFMTDAVFKTTVMLYVGLAVSILYSVANVVFAIQLHTAWYNIFAGYYAIIGIMRFLLLRYVNRNPIGEGSVGEWRRMRLCGIILTLINLSVSSAVLMMLFFDRGAKYDGLFIYVVAAYTFYAVTLSVINIVKYRKYKSPVLSSVKVLSLATALVSMLMLTAAMLSSFGGETPEETKKGLIAGAGALISALILTLSSYMIIRSTKEIENSSKEKSDE